MRKFKSKANNHNKILNIIIIILFIIFFGKMKLEQKDDFFLSKIYKTYENSRINDIDFMLDYALGLKYQEKKEEVKAIKYEAKNENEKEVPIVYIYNTHQSEEYKSSFLDTYNIPSTVHITSKMLKEKLDEQGIYTIVENSDLIKTRNNLGLKYGKSYVVSRMALEDAVKINNTLEFFIDIHRDSGKYTTTTISYNNENYAKVLFVIGLDNPTYEQNLKLAETISNSLNNKINGLSRGIVKKSGKGVNGVYNQDFNKNTLLIEVGGENNYINEVYNTTMILGEVLSEYIRSEKNEL